MRRNYVYERSLRQLATGGFAKVSPTELGSIAAWCRDHCRNSGDARFCLIGSTLSGIDRWWARHEKGGGIPVQLEERIGSEIMRGLPAVLETPDPADAAGLAAAFEEEIGALLLSPDEWVLHGFASPLTRGAVSTF